MDIKVGKDTYNLDWCSQIAFKGKAEDCNLLCKKLGEENVRIEKKGNDSILKTGGFDVEEVLKMVKKFSNLKVCAFLDEFDICKHRKTYVVYSEAGRKKFTHIKFVGVCDGQSDIPFSEEADLLQSRTKKYTYTLSLTGLKRSISYRFPFALQWEDNYDNNLFKLDGDILKKYIGTSDKIIIPNGVTTIEATAFKNNKIIKEVFIPKSVKIILSYAFSGCVNLKHVTFEKGINFIGSGAFFGCKNLEEISIPDSLSKTSMRFDDDIFKWNSTYVFSECTNLKHVTLSKKMKDIPQYFFYKCENLEKIVLPNGIKKIELKAFSECKKLKQIILPEGIKKIDYSFENCSELTDIFIPSTVEKIAYNAFSGCKKLVIHTPENSYASKYASECNINFVCEKEFPVE